MLKIGFMFLIVILPMAARAASERTVEKSGISFCVRNQGGTSTCWLHSAVQMMEQLAGTTLSIDALLLPEIKSRALARYLGFDTPWDGGAGPTRPFALALEHGLVPETIWRASSPVVQNYGTIFNRIEILLKRPPNSKDAFLSAVDQILKEFVGELPPEKFHWQGRDWTAVDFARNTIGQGDSVGYDFRNIPYSDTKYGRLPEVAWTTIIDREGNLKKITDIIAKRTERVSADEAFDVAVRIFREKRPVAFTFIYFDADGNRVLNVNENREYVSVRPAVIEAYTGSHLVLIEGLVLEGDNVVGFEILDSLTNQGSRFITQDFFATHGKTVHEISPECDGLLKP